MPQTLGKSFAAILISQVAVVYAAVPGSTLADCETFAALFSNTCTDNTPIDDISTHTGLTLNCEGTMRCPNTTGQATYTSSSPCSFEHKMCVTCYASGSHAMIRVQSNGLPNHCVNSTVNNGTDQNQDFEVRFQPPVDGTENYTDTDVDTSAKTDEILCDLQRTNETNMLRKSRYNLISGAATQTSAGMALSGMHIFNALDAYNRDAVENEAQSLDSCYSHPQGSGILHYHYWSPCIKAGLGWASTTSPSTLCRATTDQECMTDPQTYTLTSAKSGQVPAFQDTSNFGGLLGIARDGHIIVGPYNSSGTQWTCDDHDICNGAFIDGQYVYVSTGTFPYLVGCWGPGPQQTFQASCSTNSCGGTTAAATEPASEGANRLSESMLVLGGLAVALSATAF